MILYLLADLCLLKWIRLCIMAVGTRTAIIFWFEEGNFLTCVVFMNG